VTSHYHPESRRRRLLLDAIALGFLAAAAWALLQ
jgi:hypothetical protein